MPIEPYLFFEGRADEALELYRRVLGAEVQMLMRFKESPEPVDPKMCGAGYSPDKIMHATVRIGETTIMASDGRCSGKPTFGGFSLSIGVASEQEAERVFKALGEGGQVTMPRAKTFGSPRFGMLTDRFGVGWMINVVDPAQR